MNKDNKRLIGFKDDPRIVLSTLWVFILMNMVYADIIGTLKPTYLTDLQNISKTISGETVLFFAVLMEIPIIMILLSRLLNRRANRITNFIGAPLSILWVVIPSIVMSDSSTPLSYVFFATIEVMSMIFILWYCWKWKID